MKNGFDALSDVYGLLNVPSILSLLDDGVYMAQRPRNSHKSDIVIGCMFLNNEVIQEGVINVRMHVPDLTPALGADYAKLDIIADAVTVALEDQYRDSFYTEVFKPAEVFLNKDQTSFALIQVMYRAIQTNKNI